MVGLKITIPAEIPAYNEAVLGNRRPKSYTIESLQRFTEFEFDGRTLWRNARSDVIDKYGDFIGWWDGCIIRKCYEPNDWFKIAV
jgi:hypothetical protein